MKLIKILCIVSAFTFPLATFSFASDYPLTREEKKLEEVGSVLGDEGIVFKAGHLSNLTTKTSVNNRINDYLWKASLKVLENIPLASSDSSTGVIVTDWYSTIKKPNYGFKIQVNITGDIISPEAIKVTVYERTLKNNQWYNQPSSQTLSATFEDKIIRLARELFIKNNNKK